MIKIKAEHEDTIYPERLVIQEMGKMLEDRFDSLFEELKSDGFCDSWDNEDQARDFLFDYFYNCDEEIEFWNYCKSFGLEMEV